MMTVKFGCSLEDLTGNQNRKDTMNTTDKIINDLAIQLANKAIENASYKAHLEEAQDQLVRINNVLDSDQALKDLFDEASQKLEEGK